MSAPEEVGVSPRPKRPHIAIRISKAMAWTIGCVLAVVGVLIMKSMTFSLTPDVFKEMMSPVTR